MREIKFRGLTKEGKWVYGYYAKFNGQSVIIPDAINANIATEVLAETVGQFVKVINGKEIWEGDLLTGHRLPKRDPFLVEWDEDIARFRLPYSYNEKELEIIGNIHQNPELLK